jgi:fructuronate reductase
MKLTDKALSDRAVWDRSGFTLPSFDRAAVIAATISAPQWIHFGAGNIFRGFPAVLQQRLLDEGIEKTGVIVAEGFDYEIIEKIYRPHNNLSALVVLKGDGTTEKKIVASITESLVADPSRGDWTRIVEIFSAPSLRMASFTITEKGYGVTNAAGETLPDVVRDIESGPSSPVTLMGKITALCAARFAAGKIPLALVSMDNCSHNGTRLYEAVHRIALEWTKRNFVPSGFLSYIENPESVSFPWSMIDKITPRPDSRVRESLESAGFEDTGIVVTSRNTWIAPFVNAEETEYLVIEDLFPNGRPDLDRAGVIFADRATVDRVEKMKVCTCLNPLHTALAIFGCLLSYASIHDEMNDPDLVRIVERLGYVEGMPVVVDPGIIRPVDFLRTVLETRLPNPFMPDTPQRIACDTSQKMPVRFGETLKAYIARSDLSVDSLVCIPLVFAGWCRYLMGLDDSLVAFERSPDPLLARVSSFVAGIKIGDKGPFHESLSGLLSAAAIFGVDLYEAGLGEKVEAMFAEMVAAPGAVRATLKKYL